MDTPKHKRFQNLVGKKFGRLTVLLLNSKVNGCYTWKCKCDCGNEVIVRRTNLSSGHTKSCGCYSQESRIKVNTIHGMKDNSIYKIWKAMTERCRNPNNKGYRKYGGRGIKVCERWKIFQNFYADMGDRPSANHSIDRINNDGDYDPANCRWATAEEQANNKSNNRFLVLIGERDTLPNWCRRLGLEVSVVRARLKYGWSHEKALLMPAKLWPNQHVRRIFEETQYAEENTQEK